MRGVACADFYSATKRWEIQLTISSSNGRRIHVDGSWHWRDTYSSAPAGCQDAAAALVPAVQDTISRIVNDPTFPALLAAAESGPSCLSRGARRRGPSATAIERQGWAPR